MPELVFWSQAFVELGWDMKESKLLHLPRSLLDFSNPSHVGLRRPQQLGTRCVSVYPRVVFSMAEFPAVAP